MKRLYARLVLWLIRPALHLDWGVDRGQGVIDVSSLESGASHGGKGVPSKLADLPRFG